jgi:hypothetical protein
MRFVPNAESAPKRLVVLAPVNCEVPDSFIRVEENLERHQSLLAQMQALRGARYLKDGAITPLQLSVDGRHRVAVDEKSWHLLAVNSAGSVCGGARCRQTSNRIVFSDLGISASPLAQSDVWGMKLRAAVETDLELARRKDVAYMEFGGWAVAEESCCTTEALRIALGVYSLSRSLGGCVGITAATRRHHSSSILRRIGGRPLAIDGVELPPYYDPQYDCEMEMLRFESEFPNPRYDIWIEEIRAHLLTAPVVRCRHSSVRRDKALEPINVTWGPHNGLSH